MDRFNFISYRYVDVSRSPDDGMIFLVHNHRTRENRNIFEYLLTDFSQGCDSSEIALNTTNEYVIHLIIYWA
jgi:hypothetical protein